MPEREKAVALALLGLAAVLALAAPAYFAPQNLRDVFLSNLPVLIVALGATLVIVTGEIDISCGSMFAVCSVVAGLAGKATGSIALACAAACAAGVALGALDGALVAYARVPSIVVTLATMIALRDALRWATDGAWVTDLPPTFQWFGLSRRHRIPPWLPRCRCCCSRWRRGCWRSPPPGAGFTRWDRIPGRTAGRYAG